MMSWSAVTSRAVDVNRVRPSTGCSRQFGLVNENQRKGRGECLRTFFLAGGCSELAELAKSQQFGPGAMFTNQSSFLRKKN